MIVKFLVEKGADVNVLGGQYGHALQAASSKGHEAIVRLLLEAGADVSVGEDYSDDQKFLDNY
jgi:ankyrin repeat protein